MKSNNGLMTFVTALIVSPIAAGFPACLVFWIIAQWPQKLAISALLSSSFQMAGSSILVGLVVWTLAAPFALFIGLYFISKNQIAERVLYAMAVVPLPVFFMSNYIRDWMGVPGMENLIVGFAFAIPSALLLAYMTSGIEIPFSKKSDSD